MSPRAVERRIRLAAALLLLGLVLEAVTLLILHPLAFVAFASLGVLLFLAGMVTFILTLLHVGEHHAGEPAARESRVP
jgi:hypothetical protein